MKKDILITIALAGLGLCVFHLTLRLQELAEIVDENSVTIGKMFNSIGRKIEILDDQVESIETYIQYNPQTKAKKETLLS